MNRQTSLFASLAIITFLTPLAFAAPDSLSDLNEKLEQVEEKNNRLEEELLRQREALRSLSGKANELERSNQSLSEELDALHPNDPSPEGKADYDHSSGIPPLKITGFWDFGYNATFGGDQHNRSFITGELDLFITAEISESVHFMTESVFYPVPIQNRLVFEMQRVLLKYSISDLLNLQIGRMHTALGYWNHAYHHGTWLQTSILRPEIYRFDEYDNGILPVHSIGVELFGTKALRPFDVEYHLGVTNGRSKTTNSADDIQNIRDENASKALSILLGLKPHWVEGLQVGGSLYLDKIPPNAPKPTRVNPIDEWIIGTYAVYFLPHAELLGEIFKINHHDQTSGKDFDTLGFYLQGA